MCDDEHRRTNLSRRDFMQWALAFSLVSLQHDSALAKAAAGSIPYRQFGATDEKVSAIGVGGYHMGVPDEAEGIRIVRTALDQGINFLDNCWDYHGGVSEERMGKALQDGYRSKAFLMTKIDGRDKITAAKQIDDSLRRLKTDIIDLLQIHEVIRMSDPDRSFAPDGTIHALIDAKKAGKIRYIGFTGHKNPEMHLKMLETAKKHDFRFDSVQMPLNVMDAHYESFEKKVLPVLVNEKIAVLGMKPMGAGVILSSGVVTAPECLRYALSLPTTVVITGCDSMHILQQALKAAREFKPLTADERLTLLKRTQTMAAAGQFELYKTSQRYDGTAKHPEWLG